MQTTEKCEFCRVGFKSVNDMTHHVQSLLEATVRLKVTEDNISLIVGVLEP